MKNRGTLIVSLLFLASLFSLIIPASAAIPLPDDSSTNQSAIALNVSQGSVAPMVALGRSHLVGLKSDGTVVAVGWDYKGPCEVSDWTDIVQVAAGDYFTVGLRSDGTVVTAGSNSHGQSNLGLWTDIVQIATGPNHVVGLKCDGTVVAKGGGSYGQWRGVGDWTDITQVATGGLHTVGLKSDGTVVAVGCVDGNNHGQCSVSNWTDITQVAASNYGGITYGLRPDGTVIAVGDNDHGQCDVGSWTNIVQVAMYWWTITVGLKNDGTLITTAPLPAAVNVSDWNGIIQVSAGTADIAGLKSDGTVLSTVPDLSVGDWNLGITTDHSLTISSTAGGYVITPGEDSFNYTAGAMIHLFAKPDAGYHFVNWTGDVDAIFSVNAAATIITMNNNHSITANFEKNPPILLTVIGIMVVAALAFFFFRERITTRTPFS